MDIHIVLDGIEPLAGRIRTDGGSKNALGGFAPRRENGVVPFEGWLGLVSALYGVLELDDGGQADARPIFDDMLAPPSPESLR